MFYPQLYGIKGGHELKVSSESQVAWTEARALDRLTESGPGAEAAAQGGSGSVGPRGKSWGSPWPLSGWLYRWWLSASLLREEGLLSLLVGSLALAAHFYDVLLAHKSSACPRRLGRASRPQAGHSHR